MVSIYISSHNIHIYNKNYEIIDEFLIKFCVFILKNIKIVKEYYFYLLFIIIIICAKEFCIKYFDSNLIEYILNYNEKFYPLCIFIINLLLTLCYWLLILLLFYSYIIFFHSVCKIFKFFYFLSCLVYLANANF